MNKEFGKEPACANKLDLNQLMNRVRNLKKQLLRSDLEVLLTNVVVTPEEYKKFKIYAEPYGRVSVIKNEKDLAELLIMTWQTDQESIIHDHFTSACGIRVLAGAMTEMKYDQVSATGVKKSSQIRWPRGSISTSEADLDIHRVTNKERADLITLHLYSPPLDLTKIRRFSELD